MLDAEGDAVAQKEDDQESQHQRPELAASDRKGGQPGRQSRHGGHVQGEQKESQAVKTEICFMKAEINFNIFIK